jgi:hypothetical protein
MENTNWDIRGPVQAAKTQWFSESSFKTTYITDVRFFNIKAVIMKSTLFCYGGAV